MTKNQLTYRILSGAAEAAWATLHAKRVAARRAENRPWNQYQRKEAIPDDHGAA